MQSTVEPTQRRTARQVFEAVEDNTPSELRRSGQALAVSGFAGGLTMGLTGLGVASALAVLGESPLRQFAAYLVYPVGFVAVINRRAQLFTENTLYPVALILSERRHMTDTGRLWAIVFVSNALGASAFAVPQFLPRLYHRMSLSPRDVGDASRSGLVGSYLLGVIGGWIIALVAWMATASHWTIGQIVVIWLLTFVVGIGRFSHCIATGGEIMSAVFAGSVSFPHYLSWLRSATAGNILGGVLIVTRLNFGQVKAGES